MKYGAGLVLIALSLATPALAAGAEMPAHLRCDLSGRGSCSEAICVGSGIGGSQLRLSIVPGSRSVKVDRLTGKIAGDAPLALGEAREILWTYGLVRYTRLTVQRRTAATPEGRSAPFVAHLSDGERHLEFQCRKA